jgi:hypothetical protein
MRTATKVLVLLVLLTPCPVLEAYETGVHRQLALRAAHPTVSSVDQTLRDDLGMRGGSADRFLDRTVEQLIGDGAYFEDVPFFRVLHHFHNPLASKWEEAGLRVLFQLGQSSVLWQQDLNQDLLPFNLGGGDWSWQDARRRYLDVLTGANRAGRDNSKPAEREQTFADLFRNLGQLTHLVQDATVPAHVRNDPHVSIPLPFDSRIPLNPDWFEDWVDKTRNKDKTLFNHLLTLAPFGPTRSIFTPINEGPARIPIAWLIDRDIFQGQNTEVLGRENRGIGISEYTNGNFLSRDTIFKRFGLPRIPAVPQFDEVTVGSKVRRYLMKPADGQPITHLAVEGMLFEPLKDAGRPFSVATLTLDDLFVHKEYAGLLLPRAVGYSAALLDYFFRGKLDVDLVEAGSTDPSEVQVNGTSASEDTLDGGTLTLYADVPAPAPAQGMVRVEAPAVQPNDPRRTVTAKKGDPVASATFRVPEEAERFVAVYKGKLGDERPQGDFPGAVIGKAFGGVRVEEVFSDSARWHLRTPQGVFPLPIMVSGAPNEPDNIEELRWGDVDNTLVGRTKFGPGQPSMFVTFRIARGVGSVDVPLREPDAAGLRLVDITKTGEAAFPFGRDIGTTVTFSGSDRVVQQLLTFAGKAPLFFFQELGDYFSNGSIRTPADFITFPPGIDDPARRDGVLEQFIGYGDPTDLQVAKPMDEKHEVSTAFPLALTPERFESPEGRPYFWRLTEFGLDPTGRILAQVDFQLTVPENNTRTVMTKIHHALTGNLVDHLPHELRVFFPIRPIAHVVVDVGKAQVVSNTASETAVLSFHAVETMVTEQAQITGKAIDGPLDGEVITRWRQVRTFLALPGEAVGVAAARPREESGTSFDVKDVYRTSLEAHAPTHFRTSTSTGASRHIYAVVPVQGGGLIKLGYEIDRVGTFTTGYFTLLRQSQRRRPGSAAEQLILFGRPVGIGEGDAGILVKYAPETDTAEVALSAPLPPAEHKLGGTTSEAALVISSAFGSPTTRLVRFDRDEPQDLDEQDLSLEFALLAPSFLYNVQDMRFYRAVPFRKTALPAKLRALTPNPLGDYHAMRLPQLDGIP